MKTWTIRAIAFIFLSWIIYQSPCKKPGKQKSNASENHTIEIGNEKSKGDLSSDRIRLVSWNLELLFDETEDDADKMSPRYIRDESDFKRLSNYLSKIDPDILAFQEVENQNALEKILPTSRFECFISKRPKIHQQLGICWKNRFKMISGKEIDEVGIRTRLRPMVHVELALEDFHFHVLTVHLKSMGFNRPNSKEYKTRIKQMEIINSYISDFKEPFLLVGDFNHHFEGKHTDGIDTLSNNLELNHINQGIRPNCWQYKKRFIDHIFTSTSWKTTRFIQFRFPEDDGKYDGNPESEKGLTDHCPISVDLKV